MASMQPHEIVQSSARSDSLYTLPENLPVPLDDGACNHLPGTLIPSVDLLSTDGSKVNPSKLAGLVVLYFYPRTGVPNRDPPNGWNEIPGARGCTPQSCSFRDHFQQLRDLGVQAVFGVSTQDTEYQREAHQRLHLPFHLLSDRQLELTTSLKLPTFNCAEVDTTPLIKRMCWIVCNGKIIHVFYPVFPPDSNAEQVVAFLKSLANTQ